MLAHVPAKAALEILRFGELTFLVVTLGLDDAEEQRFKLPRGYDHQSSDRH